MAHKANHIAIAILAVSALATVAAAETITYSRRDKDAYIASRKSKHSHKPVATNDKTARKNDDPNPCTIYLAPSSIPNAGLGMYTSTSIPANTTIGPPQLGLLLQDPTFHTKHSNSFNLLSNYVWSATPLTHGEFEVTHGEAVCTGIGMMANAHYGLINVHHYDKWKSRAEQDGTDAWAVEGARHATLGDVGRGAYSWHAEVRYESLGLTAGEEIFLSYGPQVRRHLLFMH